jgi:hypothetical protein
MMADLKGKNYIGLLSEDQVLPDNGTADSTNMVEVQTPTNGDLWVKVVFEDEIVLADTKTFTIDIQTWSADVAASAVAPINSGGAVIPTGTSTVRPFSLLSAHATTCVIAAGTEIDFAVPEDQMASFATPHKFIQLVYTTTDDLSGNTATAFVYTKV